MTPEAIREMKGHLRFLEANRNRLGLKFNAKEEALLDGSEEPTERGVCIHMLRKVDRNCVQRALRRIEEAETRVELLEGVIGLSSDVGFLILYLESLRDTQSRSKAAAALSLGLARIDFAEASPAQLERVFDLMSTLFPRESLPELVFGLLQAPSFREAFDRSTDRLPSPLADILVPIRTLFLTVVEGVEPDDRETLRAGLTLFLGSTDRSLTGLAAPVRRRLFSLELALSGTAAATDGRARGADAATDDEKREKPGVEHHDRVLGLLHETFPHDDRLYSGLGLDWARQLMRRHDDDKARELLARVAAGHPGFDIPGRWLKALDQARVGRVALGSPPHSRPLHTGFWLDGQQEVAVRVGRSEDQADFERRATLHASLAIPSLAPLVAHGVSDRGLPYIATRSVGRPANDRYRKRPRPERMIDHLDEGLRLLWCLARAGVSAPRFGLDSCFVDQNERLWLQDLAGYERAEVESACTKNLAAALTWCEAQLDRLAARQRPLFGREALRGATGFAELLDWSRDLR